MVTGGDDVEPDPNRSADEPSQRDVRTPLCLPQPQPWYRTYKLGGERGIFGVMQPTGMIGQTKTARTSSASAALRGSAASSAGACTAGKAHTGPDTPTWGR